MDWTPLLFNPLVIILLFILAAMAIFIGGLVAESGIQAWYEARIKRLEVEEAKWTKPVEGFFSSIVTPEKQETPDLPGRAEDEAY